MKHIQTLENFLNENLNESRIGLILNDLLNKMAFNTKLVADVLTIITLAKEDKEGNAEKAVELLMKNHDLSKEVALEGVTEGQFSWMTQDTNTQIGSERENTIAVYMFSNKGEKWEEKRYKGYGEFGGKDYYELLAQMNGVENANRQDGIDIAFGKKKVKGKVLFPALVQYPNFNWKRHDFTEEPANDPNQSWYQEPEDDDDDDYDEYDESLVSEEKSTINESINIKIKNMKHIQTIEGFLNEASKSKSPNDVETIDVDLAGDDKDIMDAIKKFNIKAKKNSNNRGMGHDLTGTKKDLIAYLQSEYLELDDQDIKDLYPELLEGSELDEAMVQVAGKGKPSGAKVLAMEIMKYLDELSILPNRIDKKNLETGIAQIIMDSTF